MTGMKPSIALDRAEILENLGPLAQLAGSWEGVSGHDTAPSDDRGTEINLYRERMTFDPFGPVDNHEQKLFGLRYSTVVHRLDEPDPFHEVTGYWLWDSKAGLVMRCFLVPRGISVIAGGMVAAGAKEFALEATLGSSTFGICSNPFLDREFKTVRYTLQLSVAQSGTALDYEEVTFLQMPGRMEIFRHVDKNSLKKI